MIRRYGDDAVVQTAMGSDALLAEGVVDGLLAWLTMIRAIDRLQVTEPKAGEALQWAPASTNHAPLLPMRYPSGE